MASQIVFNLSTFSDALFLPSAFVVEIDKAGKLSYPLQRATIATIGAHGHELTPALTRLFDLIDTLTPKNLEARFKPPKAKAPTPLAQLLSDVATKPSVEKFIFSTLDAFLEEIVRDAWPLTLDLERKTHAQDVQIILATEPLVPHIAFNKTAESVEYRFQLGTDDEKWPIQSRNVRPLTNTDPAWLLVDHTLFRVPGINGNMVKPFRTKDVVIIPADKARVYFRQFVAKSAGRTRIEAEGFDVQTARELLATHLRPTENILEKAWYLQVVFSYAGAEFTHGERRDNITTVDFTTDGSEDIVVRKIVRDRVAEQEKVTLLLNTGLAAEGKLFKATNPGTLETLIEWLANHQATLEAAGFSLELPQVDGQSVALLTGQLDVSSTTTADWFDVSGQVQAGTFSFPFKALWQHLRKRDRFFRLPDGTFFLIPEAWFARFSELAEAAKDGPDDVLRLPKALFTLLPTAVLTDGTNDSEFQPIDPEKIDYQASDDLKAALRPYQLQGVKWLVGHYRAGFGACLADDMGLGKTLQTIALLLYAKEHKGDANQVLSSTTQLDMFQAHRAALRPLNALIILPASLVFNWQNELARFVPSLFVCAHTGTKRGTDARALAGYDIVLTTYQTARQDLDLLQKIPWHVLVLDESQQIKNRASEVSKVVLSLQSDCKISLSGTPIENSLSDLWMQMEFINPATLGSFSYFRERFLLPIEKRDDTGAKQRLFSRVRPFFLRRTKEEVAPDLPALTEQLFYTEMAAAQQKLYDQTKSAARNEILALFDDPKTRFQALQALTRLRQLANDPRLVEQEYKGGSGKFDDVLAQWDTIRRAGHKVLFFSSFERHLQLFRAEFEAVGHVYAWLTGDTPVPERAREVTRFQEDATVQAFFMTIKAGGVGLNLTAADYVFLLDPWWNPASEDQAIARAHRIGQTRPVTALRFLSRNTIEEKIRALQERKKKLGQALFEADEPTGLTREELESLLV
jgi:superfamily II DNA or RNA helicase